MNKMDTHIKKRMTKTNHGFQKSTLLKVPADSSETTDSELMDFSSSSDFPSSQEPFSIGWDWSGQVCGTNRPTIRVVERPARKRNQDVELLQCHRPRRLVEKDDPDMFDASSFVDQLKSLASGFKRVPESNSPVASPPHSLVQRRGDHLITPTSLKSSHAGPSSRGAMCTSETPTHHKETEENQNESLIDLLDDSLSADLLKCTQDLEHELEKNAEKTPRPQNCGKQSVSSSRKKSRLSLSSKKNLICVQNRVCRRIPVNYDTTATSSTASTNCGSGRKQDKENNNSVLQRNNLDKATVLTINKLEETEPSIIPSLPQTSSTNPILEDDDEDLLISPDVLTLLDHIETEENQKLKKEIEGDKSNHQLPSDKKDSSRERASSSLNRINKQHADDSRKGRESEKNSHQLSSRKKYNSGFRCTPEEIEKKRQDARKRLQLKKK